MPTALHPQAKFDPIPPDLDVHSLVDRTPNFQWVLRISAAQIRNIGPQEFEKLVYIHVIHGGKPLVIEKWNDRLPKSIFSAKWLEETYNKKEERVRDIVGQADIPMTMGHYLRSMKQLTNQWTPANFRDDRRQRLYLKDIDCPPEWQERLQKIIPPNLFYMNENVEERGSRRQGDDLDMFQEEHTAAPAGDLMSSLPEEMRAQNLMCYVGHEGTYTPAHREMCASLGQNIMIDASGDENGEKPGSSIWFMTETKDREVVREYFMSMLGHDIEIEKHFAQINAWKKATFPVYIVEQKVGDFILVPPLAPHQVWNRGTRTIKVAWNRTTVETLAMALHEALPKARIVCRDEQYKNKAIIFYTLEKYYKQMLEMERTADIGLLGFGQDLIKNSTRMKQMMADFKSLFSLYTEVLLDEMFASKEKDVEFIEFDSNITCSYCRADIFNRFLTCKHCIRQLVNGDDEDTYDVCMECYAMGRSCICVSNLKWCEQWHWADLVERYEDWRSLIIKNDGFVDFDVSPLPLELARKKFGKKAVAQICQEQLRRRPWKDLTAVEEPEQSEPEPEVDDNGNIKKKKKKKKRKPKKGDVYRCHVCSHKEYTYKLAFCSTPGCTEAYCYGVLYRAFDLMPQEVMQNEQWQCPRCLNNCNCGSCRRSPHGNPYIPKNTLLGHDTRPIADDRSIESLIDFRVHNLSWLKNVGEESRSLSSKRMQRLQIAAAADKANGADIAVEVPALSNGELAESTEGQQATANGYGDQSEVLGHVANEYGTHPPAVQNVQDGADARVAEVADMSVSPDESSYPDPSVLAHERVAGMGYYDQDNSSDKILFDPYQVPSVETLAAVEEEEPQMMSEYFKKQMRMAKRRARQEDDNDPDFAAPRSHHRKRQKVDSSAQQDGQADALNNMDPALFDQTMADAPADGTPDEDEDAHGEPENPPDGTEPPAEGEHRPYSPNRPTLRHARPKISYLYIENGEEEFDDIIIPRSQRPPPEGIANVHPDYAENASKDPLDLSSAAVLTITTTPGPVNVAPGAAAAGASSNSQKKRRGRPPGCPAGRPRKSDVSNGTPSTSNTPRGPGKRRGRPPHSPPAAALSAETSDSEHNEENASLGDLDAQLAQQLEGFDDDGEFINHSSSREPTTVPKRRGRPPASGRPRGPASVRQSIEVDAETRPPLMSMADRMRLKGKKFKIGERKSSGQAPAAEPTPSTSFTAVNAPQKQPGRRGRPSLAQREKSQSVREEEEADEDFNPAAEEEPISSEDEAPAPAPPVAHADVDDDDGDPFASPPPAAKQPVKTVVSISSKSRSQSRHSSPAQDYSSPAAPRYSPSQSPSPDKSSSEEEEEEEDYKSPTPAKSPTPVRRAPPPPPPKPAAPAGPTIVRLVSSDDEGSGSEEYYSPSSGGEESAVEGEEEEQGPSSSDSDSDGEDIPAVSKPVQRARGMGSRMAVRGGGGRGGGARGRGTGRGVARRGYS